MSYSILRPLRCLDSLCAVFLLTTPHIFQTLLSFSFYSVMKVLLFFTLTSSMLIKLADTLHLCHSVEVVTTVAIISHESSVHIVNLVNELLRQK